MTYQIVDQCGCTIVFGAIPARALVGLLQRQSDQARASSQLAARLGASFVFGDMQALQALESSPQAREAAERAADELIGQRPVSPAARRWLIQGERGRSSDSMFREFTAVEGLESGHYPRTLPSLRLCRLLLEQVPEFAPQLPLMGRVSPAWERLVASWPQICGAMDAEFPRWREGVGTDEESFTYCLLKQVLRG